jgi:hypothetical protein
MNKKKHGAPSLILKLVYPLNLRLEPRAPPFDDMNSSALKLLAATWSAVIGPHLLSKSLVGRPSSK